MWETIIKPQYTKCLTAYKRLSNIYISLSLIYSTLAQQNNLHMQVKQEYY